MSKTTIPDPDDINKRTEIDRESTPDGGEKITETEVEEGYFRATREVQEVVERSSEEVEDEQREERIDDAKS